MGNKHTVKSKKLLKQTKDSFSPSLKLHLDLENIEEKVFVKVFVNSSSYVVLNKDNEYHDALPGLEYELNFYKNIIKKIQEKNICPHFAKYLGSGSNITEKNIYNKLKIMDIHIEEVMEQPINYSWTYDLLALERFNKDFRSFKDILTYLREINVIGNSFWQIMFQVLISLYVLEQTKTVHNDIQNLANICVEVLDEPRTVVYELNHKIYVIKSKFVVYLVDFDRAYCEELGNNNMLVGDLPTEYMQSNKFIKNKDIYQLFAVIADFLNQEKFPMMFATILTVDQDHKDPKFPENFKKIHTWLSQLENYWFFKDDIKGDKMTEEDFSIIVPIEKIIQNVSSEARFDTELPEKYDHYYTCNPKMFVSE